MQATINQQLQTGMPALTLTSPFSDYAGFKVTSYLAIGAPLLASNTFDELGWLKYPMFGLCGLTGAILAISGDTPKNTQDWIMRMVVGVMSACLFGGAIIEQFGSTPSKCVAILGLVGLSSWYTIGTITKLLIYYHNTESAAQFIKAIIKGWAAFPVPPVPPAPEQQILRVEKTTVVEVPVAPVEEQK